MEGADDLRSLCFKLARVLLLASLLAPVCFSRSSSEQAETRKRAILLGRCVGNCLFDTLSQEYAFSLADAANHSRIAVRLCSNERFEIAVALANSNLIAMSEVLKRWKHVNLDEIALLLSDDCLPEVAGRVATEFWAVAPSASLPSHSRNVRLTDISTTIIREGNHRSKVEEFIKQLQQKPDSYGFVKGSYFRNPSSTLKRRVGDAEKQVSRNANLKDRFAVGLVPYGIIYSDYVEPKEPVFLIIQILKRAGS